MQVEPYVTASQLNENAEHEICCYSNANIPTEYHPVSGMM